MLEVILPLHISLATLALILFVWRGWSMWRGSTVQAILWRRIVPDSVDTLLLLSGVSMAFILGLNPMHHEWLLAKLTAVLIYIGLGFVALHPGTARRGRRSAFLAALLVFGYIVAVAHSKEVWF